MPASITGPEIFRVRIIASRPMASTSTSFIDAARAQIGILRTSL